MIFHLLRIMENNELAEINHPIPDIKVFKCSPWIKIKKFLDYAFEIIINISEYFCKN